MKKICLALTFLLFVIMTPIDVNAATKLTTPSFKEKVSPVIYKSATYHIAEKKGYTYYYTTNGKTPTKSSKKYSKSIKISKSQTLKVIAYKGKNKSKVLTQKFTVQNSYVVPSVKAGTYKKGFTVTFSLADTNTYSYYVVMETLDGEEYETKSIKNGGKITIKESACVNVWRKKKGSSQNSNSLDSWDYLEKSYEYYVNSAGISGKYASGIYNKSITPSFTTKTPVEYMKYNVICSNKNGDVVSKYTGTVDELSKLKSGYTYDIVVIAYGEDGTSSARSYMYRIK